MGYVIERLSGETFPDYCRQVLFDPLSMKASTWHLSELKQDRFAFSYRRDPQTRQNGIKVTETSWPGYMDGGLRTTIKEYGNFLIMMANRGSFEGRQVLKPATIDTMLALQHIAAKPPGRVLPTIGYAFLWILSRARNHEIFQMNGFGPAFFCEVYFDPKTRTGGAFFTTGQFSSFPAMGSFIMGSIDKLLAAIDRL